MMIITFFADRKKALAMLIITGVLCFGCLITGGILQGIERYRENTYVHVTAVVSDYDTSDGQNVWTEFVYQVDGQQYTTRIKGHSYWMKQGAEIEILSNPAAPEQIEVLSASGTKGKVALIAAIPFGVFFLLYLINYIRVRRRG